MSGDGLLAFDEGLRRAAGLVEDRLTSLLAGVEAAGTPPRLVAAMRHAVLAGGKRFRPFLVLEFAQTFGGDPKEALDVAAALECVHAYSLVHDDLPAMDNDELRRGQPTVWKAYDEWTAILAGDALLTLSFEILARSATASARPEVAALLVRELAEASGPAGMVGGQMLDLEAEKLGRPRTPDVQHVRRLQGMKTGCLIAFACRAGARVAGASAEGVSAAATYGEALGLAFQIADDLLDVAGEAGIVGKAVGKDAALGKATLVAVLGEEEARKELGRAVDRALAALDGIPQRTDALRAAASMQLSRDR